MKNIQGMLLVGCCALALTGCGPSDIASPGSDGPIIINPAPTPSPSPTPTPTASVTPAAGCPTIADSQGLTDEGTISGPTGEWRVCTLPKVIKTSSTLPKVAGLLYQMKGRVDVGCDGGFTAPSGSYASSTVGCSTPLTADTNVTLTIEPGVILYGGTGQSWLAVNRGNKINAVGTSTKPIIFTSRDNILGLNTDTSMGQWGGVVLMGRAKVTDCDQGTVASNSCERKTEGSADPALFGGTNDADNSGKMSFVQIRFSGFVLGAGKELQALTTEAIGSGTQLDHIMSFNSSDDGAEFFGGVVNMKNYIAVGADDDSLDIDTGAQGNFQYVMLLPQPGKGDALMEIDSNGFSTDTPRTKLQISNFLARQDSVSSNNEGSDLASILIRGNADVTFANGIVATPNNECIRMNNDGGTPTLQAKSTVMQCNATKYLDTGTFTAGSTAASFGSGANNNNDAYTSTLTSLFINGTNENAVPAFDVTSLSSFFTAPTKIGAVKDSADTWYAGWTCNSSTADFGTGNSGLCTSLPTT